MDQAAGPSKTKFLTPVELKEKGVISQNVCDELNALLSWQPAHLTRNTATATTNRHSRDPAEFDLHLTDPIKLKYVVHTDSLVTMLQQVADTKISAIKSFHQWPDTCEADARSLRDPSTVLNEAEVVNAISHTHETLLPVVALLCLQQSDTNPKAPISPILQFVASAARSYAIPDLSLVFAQWVPAISCAGSSHIRYKQVKTFIDSLSTDHRAALKAWNEPRGGGRKTLLVYEAKFSSVADEDVIKELRTLPKTFPWTQCPALNNGSCTQHTKFTPIHLQPDAPGILDALLQCGLGTGAKATGNRRSLRPKTGPPSRAPTYVYTDSEGSQGQQSSQEFVKGTKSHEKARYANRDLETAEIWLQQVGVVTNIRDCY